jgi:hypothetical protein
MGKPTVVGRWQENPDYMSRGFDRNGVLQPAGGIEFREDGSFVTGGYGGAYTILDANNMKLTFNAPNSEQKVEMSVHYVATPETLTLTLQKVEGMSVLPPDMALPTNLVRPGRIPAAGTSKRQGY